MLTGESVPVEKAPGNRVAGATINLSGVLVVRATAVGSETALAQIVRIVEQAQIGKAGAQRLVTEADLLCRAGAVEADSEHPIGRAITAG